MKDAGLGTADATIRDDGDTARATCLPECGEGGAVIDRCGVRIAAALL